MQALDSGLVRPRARLRFAQAAIIASSGQPVHIVASLPVTLDLFEPPLHIRHLPACLQARQEHAEWSLKTIAAMLGINHMIVKRAFDYGSMRGRERSPGPSPPHDPRLCPIPAPDPQGGETGLVFKLVGHYTHEQMTPPRIGRMISEIGRRAGVVVRKSEGKFASAHDLRRSFGTRWAPKVKPATLQLLMRHRSIETTLKYYVAQDADEIADEL